jgi:hypothetical protein
MKRPVRRHAATLALTAALGTVAVAGCGTTSSSDIPGCTHPKDEDAILSEYQKDPVFSIKPPHAQRSGGPRVQKACRQLNYEDGTTTSVTQIYALTQPYDTGDLQTVYDTAVKTNGWIPLPGPKKAPVPVYVYLYCKRIHGMRSELNVSASSGTQSTRHGDVTVSTLIVAVTAAANGPACDPNAAAPNASAS